jgi:hypothetical protein
MILSGLPDDEEREVPIRTVWNPPPCVNTGTYFMGGRL